MHRLLLAATLAAPLCFGCAPSFKDRKTPSGEYCSDMPVVPAGTAPDRDYHRLQPVTSDPESRTEAQRLETLRKAACEVGADAVIEAVNEEVRSDEATYSTVSSGTAVIWMRRNTPDTQPITKHPTPQPKPAPEESPEPAPTATPTASATAAPSVKPVTPKLPSNAPTAAPKVPPRNL